MPKIRRVKIHAVLLMQMAMAVDNNRDGTISFGQDDQTTPAKPLPLLVNDDQDDLASDETVPVISPDFKNNQIKTIRDLEDFTRLKISIQNFTDEIFSGTIRVGLKWKNTSGLSSVIKIYRNVSPDGGKRILDR